MKIIIAKLPEAILTASRLLPSPIGGNPESIIKNILEPFVGVNPQEFSVNIPPITKTDVIRDENGNIIGIRKSMIRATVKAVKREIPDIDESLLGIGGNPIPEIDSFLGLNRMGFGLGPRDGKGPGLCRMTIAGYPVGRRPLRWLSFLFSMLNNDTHKLLPFIQEEMIKDIDNTLPQIPSTDIAKLLALKSLKNLFGDFDNFLSTLEKSIISGEFTKVVLDNLEHEELKHFYEVTQKLIEELNKKIKAEDPLTDAELEKISQLENVLDPSFLAKVRVFAKHSKQVQTFLPSLYNKLTVYKDTEKVAQLKDLIREVINLGYITVKESNLQELILTKLAEALNVPKETVESDIYNTKRLKSELEVIHIDGVPIDLELFKNMTRKELSSAISPTLAMLVYDEKGNLKVDKLVEILKDLEKDAKTDSHIRESVIEPIKVYFSKVQPEDIKGEE